MEKALELDWAKLGTELRQAALDAHDGDLPQVEIAYSFLLDNPECFANSAGVPVEEWPAAMPQEPNIILITAYYNVR